ncbi:MAG: hypothetical protein S0880_37635 [Actinomycetota bacterium]|nr:hypothetical protein [Actinomycetota bacterium]
MPEPSEEARAFWAEYPGMRSTAANVAAAMGAGWHVLATYVLPDRDWDEYYGPLEERRASFDDPTDDDARAILDATRREIDVRRAHGGEYGYTGYVLRRAQPSRP